MIRVTCVWAAGMLLLLAQPTPVIVLGLAMCAACGMIAQATSTGYVTATAHEGRSSAIGLYVSAFYIGGSVGGYLPGFAWNWAGWPGVVALSIAVLAVIGAIVATVWSEVPKRV
jgi:YNFM family putative membrane transporter